MKPPPIRIRGARTPLESGVVLGRLNGTGDIQQLKLSHLETLGIASKKHVQGQISQIAFISLTDVPHSYSGQSGMGLRVKTTEDGLEFYTISSGGTPGGTSGQLQYNNAGAFGGFTMSGDATIVASTGVITVSKTGGVAFGYFATGTDLSHGTGVVGSSNGGAGAISGILKANGSGTVSAAVAGTDYAAATSGSSILYGNGSGGFSSATVTGGLTFTGGTLEVASITAHAVVIGTGSAGAPGTVAVGATNTVLHGHTGADPTFSAVVEADISLANNTTNDVSTTKHGFAPKAPNDATKYLDGTGAYSVPAGSGGSGAEVLIATITPTSTNIIDFTSIPGTYKDLRVVLRGRSSKASVTTDSVAVTLNADTGSNYSRQRISGVANTVSSAESLATTDLFALTTGLPAATAPANDAGYIDFVIYDYAGSTFHKIADFTTGIRTSTASGGVNTTRGTGVWFATPAAVTRITLTETSNYVSGTYASLYGRSG